MDMTRKWNETDHPRDRDGQFTDGGGRLSTDRSTWDWADQTMGRAGYGAPKLSRGRSGRETTPAEMARGADRLDPMTRSAIGQSGARGRARTRQVNTNEYAEVDSPEWAQKALGVWADAASGKNAKTGVGAYDGLMDGPEPGTKAAAPYQLVEDGDVFLNGDYEIYDGNNGTWHTLQDAHETDKYDLDDSEDEDYDEDDADALEVYEIEADGAHFTTTGADALTIRRKKK